jgi:hypothetical protein
MKLILFSLLFLASCGEGTIKNSKDYDLLRIEDKENGVICYFVKGYVSGGPSCLKVRK